MTTPKEPVEGSIRWMHTIGIGAESCNCDLCLPLQGLPEEFRRLAAEARKMRNIDEFANQFWHGEIVAFEKAAQMLEEKLNG